MVVHCILTFIFRLGMASREECVTALNNCNWNVEEAASTLCDNVWSYHFDGQIVSLSELEKKFLFSLWEMFTIELFNQCTYYKD